MSQDNVLKSHWLKLKQYTQKMWGHKYQWISHKINIQQPGQLKKWKSWEPFWSYQVNTTANSAHLLQNWAQIGQISSAV